MNLWSQIPFLRLLLPFIAGILTAVYSGLHSDFIFYILISVFLVIALFVFVKQLNHSYSYSWIFGTLVAISIFFFGFQLTNLHTEKYDSEHFSKQLDSTELIYAKCAEPWLEKDKSYKVTMEILSLKKNGKWISTSGKAMCYFKKDSLSKQLHYGDCVIMKTNFTEIKPPQNPSEFNYKRFLSFHNIYHQAYIPSGNWKLLERNQGNPIINASYNIREYLLNIYRENNISGDEFAVGSALVLGYVDKLDQDIIQAYASSGALHVLSVSGLHVGIIFLLCNFLLRFLDKIRFGKPIRIFLLLLIIWFYAILTGLSPAVLRSAAMFSFIIIAQAGKFNTNIFNTLSVSCFALLLYNPYLIMEVGFQLSYLAVLGIVAIQPWLYEKWRPNNWLVNKIWEVIAVSIAAQAITFPLGLLYFHQFPNYFMFSNLIVIPLSTLVLVYGIFVFAIGKIPVVGIFCSKIFYYIVFSLNKSVHIVEDLPGALLQGISINILETWIIYLLIIFLLVFIYKKQLRYLFISLSITIFLLSLQTIEAHSIRKQKAIIIYNIPKISAYDFMSGNSTVFFADSFLIHNESRMLFHIKHNWWDRAITNQRQIEASNKGDFTNDEVRIKNNFIQFGDERIVVVNSLPNISSSVNNKLKVDLIILSKSPKIKICDLQKWFDFKKIIVDSSNPEWKNDKWKKECEELQIDFYSVIDSGAYVEEL